MMKKEGNLTFFSGKMGSGKTTKSVQIAKKLNAVLLSEDEWLSSLYPNQINTFDDYIKYSVQMKSLIKDLVISILQTGTNVVMDFPANTRKQRKYYLDMSLEAKASHELIYIKADNKKCLEQIKKRNVEQPQRAKFDNESVFYEVTKYFEEPKSNEPINIRIVNG